MITLDECLKQGLVSRMPPSIQRARAQLKKAEVMLNEGKTALQANIPNLALVAAYSAMLDGARALLFRDGYREKSHACVVKYLEAKYAAGLGNYILVFDRYRQQRHNTLYEGEYFSTNIDAGKAIKTAEEFLGKVNSLIK
jgi:uncharacterized protein (UPF0332 family)